MTTEDTNTQSIHHYGRLVRDDKELCVQCGKPPYRGILSWFDKDHPVPHHDDGTCMATGTGLCNDCFDELNLK